MAALSVSRTLIWILTIVVGLPLLWVGAQHLVAGIALHYIQAHFPARSIEDARRSAILASDDTLRRIGSPTLAFSASRGTLDGLVKGALDAAPAPPSFHLSNVAVRSGRQILQISADVSGSVEDNRIRFTGRADGVIAVAASKDGLVLTPSLERIDVDNITFSGIELPSTLSKILTDALSAYIAHINGQIKPIMLAFGDVSVPPQTLSFGGRDIELPAQAITGLSLLIESERLVALAEINGAAAAEATSATGDYETFRTRFLSKGAGVLDRIQGDGLALAPDYGKRLFGDMTRLMSSEERVHAGLASAWQAVHQLAGPDLALNFPTSAVNGILEPILSKALADAAGKVKLSVSDNRIIWSDGRLAVEAVATALLAEPVPGKLTFRVRLAASAVFEKNQIVLLPSLDALEIVDLELKQLKTQDLIPRVNAILAGLAAGVTEVLPSIPIDLRPVEIAAIDFQAIAKQTPGLALEPTVISPTQARLSQAAILINPDGLQVLADLELSSSNLAVRATPAALGPYSGRMEDLVKVFATRRANGLQGGAADKATIDIAWARLAQLINAKWQDVGGIRATYSLDTGRQDMTPVEIRLVDKPTYACSQTPCSFESCSFSSDADANCSLDNCDLGCTQGFCTHLPCPEPLKPFKMCLRCSGDLTCEPRRAACLLTRDARYAACRASYDVPANAEKAACDTRANAQKAACDANAAIEKAACDAGNAFQAAVSQVGGIGKISGDARAAGTLHADAAALALTEDHVGLRFAPRLDGSVKVTGALDFLPYDIGHVLVCPAKGKAPFTMDVVLPPQRPGISARLTALPDDPADPYVLRLQGHIDGFPLKAKVQPPPIEALLTQNPHLLIACNPVLARTFATLSILGRAVGLTGSDLLKALAGKTVSAVLTGDVEYDVAGFDIPLTIRALDLAIGDKKLRLQPSLSDRILGLTVVP